MKKAAEEPGSGLLYMQVLFEEPFYVGLLEKREGNTLSVCKIVFGAEPKDGEVLSYIQSRYHTLTFSPPVTEERVQKGRSNPKRRLRETRKQLAESGSIGTKAQQALQQQREQQKQVRKERSRAEKEAEAAARFAQKQEKRKEKHRGH